MHGCPQCGVDCDCETMRCSHLCVALEQAAPRQRPRLTIAQIETLYKIAASLQHTIANALTYPDDEGFRQAQFFTSDIQSMWDLTRSEANQARMQRKKQKREVVRKARREKWKLTQCQK